MRYFSLFLLVLVAFQLPAQSIVIGESGGSPDASATLELKSTIKGLLIPRMTKAEMDAISTPAKGLLVYQTNLNKGFYYFDGANWTSLKGSSVNNVSSIVESKISIISDIKNASIHGGNFLASVWQNRTLNHYVGDSSFVSINGTNDGFILSDGVYEIKVNAPAIGVGENQIRLYNFTASIVESYGSVAVGFTANSWSHLTTVVTVSSGPITFNIQHFGANAKTSTGLGEAVLWGQSVFTQVRIQKL